MKHTHFQSASLWQLNQLWRLGVPVAGSGSGQRLESQPALEVEPARWSSTPPLRPSRVWRQTINARTCPCLQPLHICNPPRQATWGHTWKAHRVERMKIGVKLVACWHLGKSFTAVTSENQFYHLLHWPHGLTWGPWCWHRWKLIRTQLFFSSLIVALLVLGIGQMRCIGISQKS